MPPFLKWKYSGTTPLNNTRISSESLGEKAMALSSCVQMDVFHPHIKTVFEYISSE